MKNHKGEIAVFLTLGLVVVGSLITLGTSLFVNNSRTNLASNSRAAGTEVIRSGSANCTCSQICGVSSNYVSNSQLITSAGARQCTCKANTPASICSTNLNNSPIPPVNPNPTNKCVSGSYMLLVDCANVCGVGNCQSCMLNTTKKYECKVGSNPPANLGFCINPRTFATALNCGAECSVDCTQCKVGDSIRYECGGVGPTLVPPQAPQQPPQPIVQPSGLCASPNLCVDSSKCRLGYGVALPASGWSNCTEGSTCCSESGVIPQGAPVVPNLIPDQVSNPILDAPLSDVSPPPVPDLSSDTDTSTANYGCRAGDNCSNGLLACGETLYSQDPLGCFLCVGANYPRVDREGNPMTIYTSPANMPVDDMYCDDAPADSGSNLTGNTTNEGLESICTVYNKISCLDYYTDATIDNEYHPIDGLYYDKNCELITDFDVADYCGIPDTEGSAENKTYSVGYGGFSSVCQSAVTINGEGGSVCYSPDIGQFFTNSF